METVLWAVRIGNEDWQTELITSTNDGAHLKKARQWALDNGFDRLHESIFDPTQAPAFGAASLNKRG